MMTLFTQEPSFSIKCLPTTPSKPHRSLLAARLLFLSISDFSCRCPKIKLSLKGYRFIYCVRVVPSPSSLAKAQSDRLNIGLIRRSLKLCCARDIRLELGQVLISIPLLLFL
uniref:Uncharacterized mitochondrial protein AtMg01180 n=1 Tax=Arabidopsis thaliana TaxID=3702 RepID=M1180_ARATH|nr:RecName: Full=Uncharacterized mitochondrial protein AtMg01180; AltName: Full=ORF111b [Arabidopsis thaliana]CAA69801.1 unnamed protein product [Arabidopsis thaliana]